MATFLRRPKGERDGQIRIEGGKAVETKTTGNEEGMFEDTEGEKIPADVADYWDEKKTIYLREKPTGRPLDIQSGPNIGKGKERPGGGSFWRKMTR